ncbi:MAG: GspH/FimT family pseudopilin [Candidatus Zixiibacteriota bacterium]
MRKSILSNRGITLMEIMVGVVIIGIVASMAVPRFATAYERMEFNSRNRDIVSALRMARSRAITEKELYGVYFDPYDIRVVQFRKHDGSGALNDRYEDGLDSVLKVDTLTPDMIWLSSSLLNDAAVFSPNGSSSTGGAIFPLAVTEDFVGLAQISLLASTGRVKTETIIF